jgi:hypothetical protein
MKVDSLAEHFYEQLYKDENPASILTTFYCTSMEIERTEGLAKIFGKLTRMYGKEAVFASVINVYDMGTEIKGNPYRILAFFAKKNMLSDKSVDSPSLTDTINENKLRIQELERNKNAR